MGLGGARDVPLADARRKAADLRKMRADGVDPLAAKQATVAKRRADVARAVTFRQAAETYVESHKAGWRNPKHAAQWTATLESYWAGDRTDFPRGVAEAALAHAVGDKAEQAYRRGDALDKRRVLMDAWAAFCGSAGG